MSETQSSREAAVLDRIEAFRRRRPRFTDEVVTLAHGAGGKASTALIDAVFVAAFANDSARPDGRRRLPDRAVGQRLVFSTDSFVVKPLRFPGGSIGHLAVHGTVNDLAVMGARPRWLSAAFVLEEGLAVAELRAIVADMAAAAAAAGVEIVTGDTKVVDRGAADGLYITTAGVGEVPAGRRLGADRVQPGDCVLVSGTIADHGMAVMLARGDLALEADIRSDTAPLGALVEVLLAAAPSTRWLRDPTRGGVATVCNELARDTNLAVVLDERMPAGATRRQRRLRPARHRPAVRRQRRQVRRRRRARRGRRRPGRPALAIRSVAQRHSHRRDPGRPARHRRPAHHLRRHPDRRHARRRSAAADLLTVSATGPS